MIEQYFIFGAGGHAKVVIYSLLSRGLNAIEVFDDDAVKFGMNLLNYPVKGSRSDLVERFRQEFNNKVIVAVGQNMIRKNIYQDLLKQQVSFGQAIHTSATIAPSTHIGPGVMIMANTVIHPDTSVGQNTIINTAALVEHDCEIGDHSHIAPGAVICGGVKVGSLTQVGSGAIVLPGVRVGNGCTIGAGAVVTQDVADATTVIGIPARIKE